jgi:hypothetical protein
MSLSRILKPFFAIVRTSYKNGLLQRCGGVNAVSALGNPGGTKI